MSGAPIFTVSDPASNYPPFTRNSPYWKAKTPAERADAFERWQFEKFKNNPNNARILMIAEGLIIALGVLLYFIVR